MIIGIDASRANVQERTGVEWYAFWLLQHLKHVIPSDVVVRLYSREPLVGPLAVLPKNWTSCVLGWPPKKLWSKVRLRLELLKNPVDVLFVPAHVPPLLPPRNTVVTIHDVAAVHEPTAFHWFERWYSIHTAKQAAKQYTCIVPSETVAQDLRTFSKDANVSVIHHGIAPAYFQEAGEAGLKKRYIGFVGRIEFKKNLDRLIDAFNMIAIDHDIDLVLAGKEGEGAQTVKHAIATSPFKGRIHVLGWVSQERAVALTTQAEVMFFATRAEGFGIPALEAMAAGTPVLVSAGGAVETLTKGATLAVDHTSVQAIADGLRSLLIDEKLRQISIESGKHIAAQFTWQRAADQTWQVLWDSAKK